MIKYKVAILAAGIGSRLGVLSKDFNKALLPIGFKAVITHVIEKFPKDTEFVIAIGHQGKLLKEYLSIAHPKNKFKFVKIDKIIGPGSGPGYSLLQCRSYLQCPFIISTVDTIILEKVPEPTVNWLGVAMVDDTSRFNSVKIIKGFAVNMLDKVASDNTHAFIGLCGIKDYKIFWKALKNNNSLIKGELQLSSGLKTLIESKNGMRAEKFTWFDTGDIENYIKAKQYFNKDIENFDFSKTDEYIYFVNNNVIKYFKDETLVEKRVKRAEILKGFVPKISKSSNHFIFYKMIKGITLYNNLNYQSFNAFLKWLKEQFWKEYHLEGEDRKIFQDACRKFYYNKTLERTKKYFKITKTRDTYYYVNGYKVDPVYNLLDKINWQLLEDGVVTRFHGDLQFDNVLATTNKKSPFILLDWRTDFGGLLEYGDLYYDLAKMYGGLILPYNLIKKGMFSFSKKRSLVTFDFSSTYLIDHFKHLYEKFIIDAGYDLKKIKILTALIFLNMSPLHNYPFNLLLHHLGKLELQQILFADEIKNE